MKYVAKIFLHEIWIDCGSNFQRTTLFSQERGVYQQSKYFYSAKHLLKVRIYFLFYKKLQFWAYGLFNSNFLDGFSTLFYEYIFKLLFRERTFFLVKQLSNVYRNYQDSKIVWPILTLSPYPAGIYLFEIDDGNNRAMFETSSKLIIKKPEWSQLCCSGVLIVSFEQIPHIVLVFILLNFNK